MTCVAFLNCLAAMVLAADVTPAPLPAEKAVASMVVPDGFRVSLVAAEPDVVQPISFTIDSRGRFWVAEALNYGEWKATGQDRIVVLEDRNGDGRAETRTVFYEGFNYITGLEVGFGGVWVMSPPNLYFVPDRNGDGKPDNEPEVVFDGFGYKESRHNLANGFTWGPDGWLYGGHGRTSPSDVGRPGDPPAKRIHCDGGVFRIHPTRRVYENFGDGTTNPWGVDFDEFGQCFVSNCVNPHLFHMLPGGHYEPWRNRPSSLYAYERLPTIADHLHYPSGKPKEMRGETPEVLAMGGGHAHCGTLLYQGGQFPKSFKNAVFMCNVHGRRINHDILTRKGSGYTASHGKDFMISGDPWFMGVTLRTGPDGSVYVSDWSDTGECHTYKPNKGNGRIYRISYGPPKFANVDVEKFGNDELIQLHRHANEWYVRHARRVLQERAAKPGWTGEAVAAALRKQFASDTDEVLRLRALLTLHSIGELKPSELLPLLRDGHEHVRGWAVRLLSESSDPAAVALATMAKGDPSAAVRLELACALQRLPSKSRWAIAEGLVSHAEDAADANLPLMIWYGFEPLIAADPVRGLQLAAAAKIPLVREYSARRTADAAAATGEAGDLGPLVAALAGASEAVQLDLLKGALEGVRGRKAMKMPAAWPAAYAKLKASPTPAIREPAVVLGLLFGDPQALADLRTVAADSSAESPRRVAALAALIEKRAPDLAPLLFDQLGDPVTRRTALRGLAAYPHPEAAKRLLAVYGKLTLEEKQDAVATLAARKETAVELLAAVEAKAIPTADISAFSARQMTALNDAKLSEQLRRVWGEVRDLGPGKLQSIAKFKAQLAPAVLKAADLANGRQLFAKSCQQCHKLFGEGGDIGPNLNGSNRTNLDYLLSNIVDPSAEVGRDYRMSLVQTKDGRAITGIVVERTPTRLTVQTATEKLVLSPDDVDAVKESPLSIMPDGQLDALTKNQVRDLIGYLMTDSQVRLPPTPK